MRRTSLSGLALALLLALVAVPAASASPLLTLRADGSTLLRNDRFLPAADALSGAGMARPAPAARRSSALASRAAATKRTVRGELARMLAAAEIDQATHDLDRGI